MSSDSFWKMPDVTKFRTPLSILKEQAEALTTRTEGVLRGEIEMNSANLGYIFISMQIIAPVLNEYRFRILRYRQPLTVYPGRLTLDIEETTIEVTSEDQFLEIIKQYLGSDNMQRIVGNLLSQAGVATQ